MKYLGRINMEEPFSTGHPYKGLPPLEKPLDNVNLSIEVLIFTLERPKF